ncbi:hypothetical protein NUU61_009101 [Penicillium alfredii]|uniref:Uncharacterized protein n=1 Tax=Penicillium alfredii TaxID=1506179 RepID=A0A9W9EME6_9EURO|nr:uncharacterized protein NUU61_009101 [Penicillium alfredii]KAJ5084522.1 hypothetical protein NUU61_009101 [Penicillium alfredii]
MDGPPPPPPPHGENPHTTEGEYRKSSDLPEGNYDIFIVPPHSSGSGFVYLPSLQCHRNSFLAGVGSTLLVVLLWVLLAPIVNAWYTATVAAGGGSIVMMLLAIASSGANQGRGSNFGGNQGGQQQYRANFGGGSNRGGQYSGNQYNSGPPPNTDRNNANENNHGPNGAEWERAREETRRKEELRRKMEEFKRKREAEAREKEKQRQREEIEKEKKREREAMEKELKERREQLEREMAAAKAASEKETRDRIAREEAEAREKQQKAAAEAKARAEKAEAEAKEKAAKEAAEKEAAAKEKAQKEAMARFAALKEAATKKYAEKKAQDIKNEASAKASSKPASTASAPRTPSPKKPPAPTAKTSMEEDDAYSFRPYDRPRRPYGGASGSSVYSESSYTPSQSTARTTPPPSHRSAYSTKDPDKIVIQGVYAFNNAYLKTPVAQLVAGQGMVTDGLVLRITTEGLFIDDDLRGIGQREWDVKAWTLKLAEVWCPQMNATTPASKPGSSNPFSFRRGGSAHSVPTNEESDAFLNGLLKVCKNTCRLASPSAFFARSAAASGINEGGPVHPPQSEFRGLHVLRASFRDQEGKRYFFVLQDTEAWKVAIGLQRLRGGALVRALGVTALPAPECKSLLGTLGYI